MANNIYIVESDDRLGYVDPINDRMYVMDDFGNLASVPFCLFHGYFQEV